MDEEQAWPTVGVQGANTAWCLAKPVMLMTTTPPTTASFAPVAVEAKHASASATTTGHEDEDSCSRTYSRKGVGAHTSNTFRCDRLRGGCGVGRVEVAAPFEACGSVIEAFMVKKNLDLPGA